MIIDFKAAQFAKFDQLAQQIVQNPAAFCDFEQVSDVYKSDIWDKFPPGIEWFCSGLDDGAEHFDLVIQFYNRRLSITVSNRVTAFFKILDESHH